MGGWYLELPADANEALALPPNSRVMLSIGDITLHRALRKSKNGYSYLGLNQQTVKQLKLIEGAELEIRLSPDTSRFGMDFPEEMQEVMAQDPEGEALFLALSDGSKRGFLHYVSSSKNSQTRINRALHIMNRVRELRDEKGD